jgi:hypothetical protein
MCQVKIVEEKRWIERNELFLRLELGGFDHCVMFQEPPTTLPPPAAGGLNSDSIIWIHDPEAAFER